ncbi:MAG: hypothetical protein ACI35R_17775 [Bacillus sp. (in: firmicutes)]
MYNIVIQKFDMLNAVLALIAVIALILNSHAYVAALILMIATIALIAAKYKYHKALIFIAYACSIGLFGILFEKSAEEFFQGSLSSLSDIGIILGAAIVIGAIAAFRRFGTNTLSIVWFCLHILILLASTQIMGSDSFLRSLWSDEAQIYTIRSYYPFLLASMLVGVFLEKYQFEIKRERQNN